MEVSEVRIDVMESGRTGLLAVCSAVLDGELCIRDIKVIRGGKGPFLSMPSRRLAERCPNCRGKNHRRARYCNDCGAKLCWDGRVDYTGRDQLFCDVVLPISSTAREKLTAPVISTYLKELARPGSCPPLVPEKEAS